MRTTEVTTIALCTLCRRANFSFMICVISSVIVNTRAPASENQYAKTKTQIILAVTPKLISAFVFTTRIVLSLFFLNPKFQASSLLVTVQVGLCRPGRRPRLLVFSCKGSHDKLLRKPTICICENKVADQLRSNCEADQRLCFRYMDVQFLFFINFKLLSFFCDYTARSVSDLDGTQNVGFLTHRLNYHESWKP